MGEIGELQEKMTMELGLPKDLKQTPTLKLLCDAFLFYYRNRKDITQEDMKIKSIKKTVDINVALLIANYMRKIIDHASVLYSLSNNQFLDAVREYEISGKIIEHTLNNDEMIAKRARIVNGINKAKHDEMVSALTKKL